MANAYAFRRALSINTPFTLAASLSLCQLFTVDLSYCECKSAVNVSVTGKVWLFRAVG